MSGPTLANLDIVQGRVWTKAAEQAAVNTFHFKIEEMDGHVELSDFSQSLDTAIHEAFKNILTSQATYIGVQGFLLNQIPPFMSQDSTAFTGSGAGTSTAMSRQTTGITSWRTAYAGPGNRGRTYWPFPPIGADETIGEPSDAYLTALDAVIATIFPAFTITGSGGSCTGTLGLRVKRTPLSLVTITAAENHKKWATQKRRGSYGRANVSPIG